MAQPTDAHIAKVTQQAAHNACCGVVIHVEPLDPCARFGCATDGTLAVLRGEHFSVGAARNAEPCHEIAVGNSIRVSRSVLGGFLPAVFRMLLVPCVGGGNAAGGTIRLLAVPRLLVPVKLIERLCDATDRAGFLGRDHIGRGLGMRPAPTLVSLGLSTGSAGGGKSVSVPRVVVELCRRLGFAAAVASFRYHCCPRNCAATV